MKKLILPLLVVIVSVFSCKKTEKKSTEITKKAVEVVSEKKETPPSKVNETKEEFLGSDGNRYVVTYAFEKNQPIAIVTSNDFSTTLNQEQAWAKGAEYRSEDYKLISKGDNVQLFVKDKEIKLSPIK